MIVLAQIAFEPDKRAAGIHMAQDDMPAQIPMVGSGYDPAMHDPTSLISQIVDQSPFGVGLIDYDGYFRKVNATYSAQYGYSVDELTGQHYSLILPREHQLRLLARHQAFLRGEEDYDGEFGVVHRDGSHHRVLIASRRLIDQDGTRLRMVSLLNFDERKRMELELERARLFIQNILDSLDSRVCVTDAAGMIIAVNQQWRRFEHEQGMPLSHRFEGSCLLEVDQGPPQGHNALDGSSSGRLDVTTSPWIADLKRIIAGSDPMVEFEYSIGSDESTRWFVGRIARMTNEGPERFVITHDEVTTLKRLQQALAHQAGVLAQQASTDELTGLANRRTVMEQLHREHERLRRYPDRVACVLALDIDHFKRVNDTLGHAAGDVALRHVAQQILQASRENDLPGRIGGEEFIVVMPDTDVQGAIRLADRIRAQIEFSPASWNNAPISLTVSIGVSEILRSDPRSQDSLERADQALYAAKHEGRNRVLAIMR